MFVSGVRRSLWLAVSTAAVLCSSGPALAGDKVPFTAAMNITEYVQFPTPDGACAAKAPSGGGAASGYINGTGLNSAMGKFTVSSVDCITSANPDFAPPWSFSSKNVVLTAANGDEIVAEYKGSATLQPTGVLVLSGNYKFKSGTGRFQGVKGDGVLLGFEDLSAMPVKGIVFLNGTIQP